MALYEMSDSRVGRSDESTQPRTVVKIRATCWNGAIVLAHHPCVGCITSGPKARACSCSLRACSLRPSPGEECSPVGDFDLRPACRPIRLDLHEAASWGHGHNGGQTTEDRCVHAQIDRT